jgi:hypothetical protein
MNEWQTMADPIGMAYILTLYALDGRVSARKTWLVAAAYSRCFTVSAGNPDVYPSLADMNRAISRGPGTLRGDQWCAMLRQVCQDAARVGASAPNRHLPGIVRDIVHDPEAPLPAMDPAWIDPAGNAFKIADSMYKDTDGDLPRDGLNMLHDALEEAGCKSDPVLCHLKSPGRHAPGCWVVDLCSGRL